mmetsp:Transcript_7854/g.28922  ORF Transcript_7854/g.28922 Transcript_7854/m.28922 type:complete len:118 (-) Transcript_7854:1135-1488(-)
MGNEIVPKYTKGFQDKILDTIDCSLDTVSRWMFTANMENKMVNTVRDNASFMATMPSARAARNAIIATSGVAEQANNLFVFGTDSPLALSIITLRAATAPIRTSINALSGEKRTELK